MRGLFQKVPKRRPYGSRREQDHVHCRTVDDILSAARDRRRCGLVDVTVEEKHEPFEVLTGYDLGAAHEVLLSCELEFLKYPKSVPVSP
jgi:hypothetical protein